MSFIQECERTMIIVEKKKEPQIDATEFSNLVESIKNVLGNGDKCIIEESDYKDFSNFENIKYFLKMHFRIGLKSVESGQIKINAIKPVKEIESINKKSGKNGKQ